MNNSDELLKGLLRRSALLLAIAEGVALLGLLGTGEVRKELLGFLLCLGFFRRIKFRVASRRLFLILVVGLILGSVVWTRVSGAFPLVGAAYAAALLLGLLWVSPEGVRELPSRLGLSFLIVCVSAALTPDVYLALIIIVYFALVLGHLMGRVHAEGVGEGAPALPSSVNTSLWRNHWGVLLTSLLLGLLVFPLIPRTPWASFRPFGGASIGYSGSLRLESEGRGNLVDRGKVALRLLEGVNSGGARSRVNKFYIAGGLIRGGDLERFDGEQWRSSSPGRGKSMPVLESVDQGTAFWEVVLEPPLRGWRFRPYGAATGTVADGLWQGRYLLYLNQYSKDPVLQEPVQAFHREVPGSVRASRLGVWSERFWKGIPQGRAQVSALQNYLNQNGFHSDLSAVKAAGNSIQLLERFFFEERRGHCELYASATALLLRLGGTPTRIATGYRAERQPGAGVLTVRESDAHAWVEVWDSKEGWFSWDPTPPSLRSMNSVLAFWESSQEVLEGLWFRWVLNQQYFEKASGEGASLSANFLQKASKYKIFCFGVLLVAVSSLLWGRRASLLLKRGWREWSQVRTLPQGWALYWERRRMDWLLARAGDVRGPDREAWEELYGHLRFGRPGPHDAESLKQLKTLRRRLMSAAPRASRL